MRCVREGREGYAECMLWGKGLQEQEEAGQVMCGDCGTEGGGNGKGDGKGHIASTHLWTSTHHQHCYVYTNSLQKAARIDTVHLYTPHFHPLLLTSPLSSKYT